MDNLATSVINPSLKKVWSLGKNTVIVLDKTIVQHLGISEDNTIIEEKIVEGGILLKLRRDS